jgi:hypothetical protein
VLAPLDPNPISKIDKIVNKLRVRYMTYVVELDVEYVFTNLLFSKLSSLIRLCYFIDSD